MSDWTEVKIAVPASEIDKASDIATMAVPYGIYIEDYSDLEQQAMAVAHIDLIDENLLKKDRTLAFVHVYISPEENPAEAVAFLRERLAAAGIKNEIDTSCVKNEDWENNWKTYFHSVPVGKKLLIHPAWEKDFDPDGRIVIDIEPGLAFGSGAHETTRLCLAALEKYVKDNSAVLDIGCGSGILSLASLKLGAMKAIGVDIDPLAVKTARENGKISGFTEPQYTLLQGNLTEAVSGKFDVVVANIVADAIISLSASVGGYMAEGAVFIVSGIIDTRCGEVISAVEKRGFRLIERQSENGWEMLVFAK